ncbi:hypothetical protein BCR36DRAFT_579040 [Piromyces finnis]|uniref:Uncharacterized protein n=1 Tax=Piromyces finnis TaxID=1754191 RepID=A0A1Y1VP95_9FUNG|nr:hypothetical protein BCR36DRAFT_579040 [Piromyces finnis]|eukprot:ORX60972.1 hypothetical protein BCR36DRAFT_579040 [Piromyces finnis]
MKVKRVLHIKKLRRNKKRENKIYIPPQTGNVSWQHIYMLSSSVIPKIYVPVLIFSAWTCLLKLFYEFYKEKEFIKTVFFPTSLLTYLGLVLSLLLVFRNTSAYDRFWEGRKVWASMLNHTRNLSRHIWISIEIDPLDPRKDEKENLKTGVMRLLIALVISIRHALRGEYGWDYDDLAELVQHVPRFNSLITTAPQQVLKILPLEIAYHIESYLYLQKGLPATILNPSYSALNAIIDNFTACERILYTPIPLIYGIHIKHAVIIYLLTLPLQIIPNCGWASVVIVMITSFTFFGIEAISSEIENPFGSDRNDLKLDEFCQQIHDEIVSMMKYFPSSIGCLDWLELEDIDDSRSNAGASTFTLTVNDSETEMISTKTEPPLMQRFGSENHLMDIGNSSSSTRFHGIDRTYGSSATLNCISPRTSHNRSRYTQHIREDQSGDICDAEADDGDDGGE